MKRCSTNNCAEYCLSSTCPYCRAYNKLKSKITRASHLEKDIYIKERKRLKEMGKKKYNANPGQLPLDFNINLENKKKKTEMSEEQMGSKKTNKKTMEFSKKKVVENEVKSVSRTVQEFADGTKITKEQEESKTLRHSEEELFRMKWETSEEKYIKKRQKQMLDKIYQSPINEIITALPDVGFYKYLNQSLEGALENHRLDWDEINLKLQTHCPLGGIEMIISDPIDCLRRLLIRKVHIGKIYPHLKRVFGTVFEAINKAYRIYMKDYKLIMKEVTEKFSEDMKTLCDPLKVPDEFITNTYQKKYSEKADLVVTELAVLGYTSDSKEFKKNFIHMMGNMALPSEIMDARAVIKAHQFFRPRAQMNKNKSLMGFSIAQVVRLNNYNPSLKDQLLLYCQFLDKKYEKLEELVTTIYVIKNAHQFQGSIQVSEIEKISDVNDTFAQAFKSYPTEWSLHIPKDMVWVKTVVNNRYCFYLPGNLMHSLSNNKDKFSSYLSKPIKKYIELEMEGNDYIPKVLIYEQENKKKYLPTHLITKKEFRWITGTSFFNEQLLC